MKTGQIIEVADERLCAVGIKQNFVARLKLNFVLRIIGVLENAQQRPANFQLLGFLASP